MLDELEASLQRAWSWDELAVYGDALLARGDPRGELIALDLAAAPGDPAWHARRAAVVARWLGDAAPRDAPFVAYGFVFELRTSVHPIALLDGPAGPYVRSCTLAGSAAVRDAARAALARIPRPWLAELTPFSTHISWTELRTALEIVELCPTLHAADRTYGDLFDAESLLVIVMRLAAVGFVAVTGPCIALTPLGRLRMHRVKFPAPPSPAPCTTVGDGKWVLWINGSAAVSMTPVVHAIRDALAAEYLTTTTQQALIAFLAFIAELRADNDLTGPRPYPAVPALLAALGMLEEVRELGVERLPVRRDDALEKLRDALAAERRPVRLRLGWGW